MSKTGYVYLMTNMARKPIYTGVASHIIQRVAQHRDGSGSQYCRRYNLTRLVYMEQCPTMLEAIAREKAIKAWKRQWKYELVETQNPEWKDLWDDVNG